jgi:hypothetical protein
MERGFFADLKRCIDKPRYSSSFADINKNYFVFRSHFFNMDNCLPETDLILSRCISELGTLIDIEKSYPDVTVPDPYTFFIERLSETPYLAQQQESGVSVLPYRTAAPAPFDYHVVIGASQEKISIVFSRLNFLPVSKRAKLGMKDQDASEIFIALHKANSLKQSAFFCAQDSFSGYAIPHSALLQPDENQSAEAGTPLLRYADTEGYREKFCPDPYAFEQQFIAHTNGSSATNRVTDPPLLYSTQKTGFAAWVTRRNTAAQADTTTANESLLQLIHNRFFTDSPPPQMYVSASSLNAYYHCSLKWLYERALNLETVSFDADLMPYTIAGSVYHEVLHEFLEALKGKPLAPPVNGQLPDPYRELFLSSLNKVFDSFPYFPDNDKPQMSRLTSRLLNAQKKQFTDNLNGFLTAFLSCFGGCAVIETEAAYSPSSENSYILNGRVDCILETPSGEGVIVDFKTKTMPAPDDCRGDGENGLADFQLPLYLNIFESGETCGKKIHTALFFSIIDQFPQVLFGRVKDTVNETQYPKKDDDVIARDDGRFNAIMGEFTGKVEQFVSETGAGRFTNISGDFNQCLDCDFNRICRTTYHVNQERNITAWSNDNGV